MAMRKIIVGDVQTVGVRGQHRQIADEIKIILARGQRDEFEVIGVKHKQIYSFCRRTAREIWQAAFMDEARRRKLNYAWRKSQTFTAGYFDGFTAVIKASDVKGEDKKHHTIITVDAGAAQKWFDKNAATIKREVRAWEHALGE